MGLTRHRTGDVGLLIALLKNSLPNRANPELKTIRNAECGLPAGPPCGQSPQDGLECFRFRWKRASRVGATGGSPSSPNTLKCLDNEERGRPPVAPTIDSIQS
jgi:hypothetical protein